MLFQLASMILHPYLQEAHHHWIFKPGSFHFLRQHPILPSCPSNLSRNVRRAEDGNSETQSSSATDFVFLIQDEGMHPPARASADDPEPSPRNHQMFSGVDNDVICHSDICGSPPNLTTER